MSVSDECVFFSCVRVCVRVYVCACVRERVRGREREKGKEGGRGRGGAGGRGRGGRGGERERLGTFESSLREISTADLCVCIHVW
jgi:hypothetical protein